MRTSRVLVFVLMASAGTAWAGSFQVSPVRLELTNARTTTTVDITNTGAQATVVQAVLRKWTQKGGEDVYTATRDLIATPPIFKISPKESQVVRVGLLVPPARHEETAYRLFLTEVPPAPRPGFVGLQVALRVSIPIFVAPLTGQAAPKLAWHLRHVGQDKIELIAVNQGTGHTRVTGLSLGASAHGPALAQVKTDNGYVLPHAEHIWSVKSPAAIKEGEVLFVRGKTARGDFQTQLSRAQ